MKFDARQLSTDEKALLRRIAVQRVVNGEAAVEVTRSYGLGAKTIFKWLHIAREEGLDALAPIPRSGRNRAVSEVEAQEIKRWIIGGDPRQYGFDFGLWTRQIVADLILDRFKISLSVTAVGKLLHRLGLTPQNRYAEHMNVMKRRLKNGLKKYIQRLRNTLKIREQRSFG